MNRPPEENTMTITLTTETRTFASTFAAATWLADNDRAAEVVAIDGAEASGVDFEDAETVSDVEDALAIIVSR